MNFWSVRNVQKYISINPYLSSNKKFLSHFALGALGWSHLNEPLESSLSCSQDFFDKLMNLKVTQLLISETMRFRLSEVVFLSNLRNLET